MRPAGFLPRYLPKGPLVEETYRLFSGWKDEQRRSKSRKRASMMNFSPQSAQSDCSSGRVAHTRRDEVTGAVFLSASDQPYPCLRSSWRQR